MYMLSIVGKGEERRVRPPTYKWFRPDDTTDLRSLLEPSRMGPYEKYPYLEFHKYRVLVSQLWNQVDV